MVCQCSLYLKQRNYMVRSLYNGSHKFLIFEINLVGKQVRMMLFKVKEQKGEKGKEMIWFPEL